MKNFLALFLILLMLLSIVPTALAEDDIPVVRILSISKNATVLVAEFNATHTDIKMEEIFIAGDWAEVAQKLPALIAAGEAPDLAYMTYNNCASYAANGYLRDITDLVEAEIDMDEFVDGVWDAVMINGKYWGVPYEVRVEQSWYNKTVFDLMGVEYPSSDWAEAWTLKEWPEKLRALTGTNPETEQPIYGHTFQGNNWYYSQLLWLMHAYGKSSPFDENGMPIWNTPEMIAMLQDLYDMYSEGLLAPNDAVSETGYQTLVANNQLAVYTGGTWNAMDFKDMNVSPMPNVGGNGNFWIDTWVMFKGSKYPDAAWEVAKWLCAKDYWDWKLAEDVSCCMPIRKDSFEEAKDLLWLWLSEEDRACLFQSAEYAFSMVTHEKMPALNTASREILNMIKTGEYSTAAETCEALQTYWEDILNDVI